jgi:putative Ca2+/H+ antiporter (TMEM165/GDT1 family)
MGDKTQLLAFLLAARFRKPIPIIAGILAATALNHAMAGALGAWITSVVSPQVLRWVLGVSFIAMAVWTLIPDEIEKDEARVAQRFGIFGATAVTFFIAEMGDKTQLATVALAAQYHPLWQVVAGTTLGMMAANVPVVWLGTRFSSHIPLRAARVTAALLFLALGLWNLYGLLNTSAG